MTFEEILDQALDMLRRRGRVTYGALKRQFTLDDAYVADLKDALLYADSHVVDDAGWGLRWTGEPLSAAQRAFEGVGRFYGEAGVLWLVRALLQHEGRISYRTLRQVCGFDEAQLAALVQSRPDVFVVVGSPHALMKLTSDIPIVFYNFSWNPEALGIVQSLRRPGG